MEQLRKRLNELSTNADAVYEQCMQYFLYVLKSNETMNLTTVTEKEEFEKKHLIDSLASASWVQGRVLDIGAGAGFPSIPLSLVKTDCQFMLCDSVGKKVAFLNRVVALLGLQNVQAVQSRVEELGKETLYDTVVTRGVGMLSVLCEYGLPFLKLGGRMVAYKAKGVDEEVKQAKNALRILGGAVEQIVPYSLTIDGQTHERHLVLIEKVSASPPQYPRGQNKPRLKPL